MRAHHPTICLHCAHPLSDEDAFCPNCGTPLTVAATTQPMGRIASEGYLYREAPERGDSLLVFVGNMLIFGTTAITILILDIHCVWNLPWWFRQPANMTPVEFIKFTLGTLLIGAGLVCINLIWGKLTWKAIDARRRWLARQAAGKEPKHKGRF